MDSQHVFLLRFRWNWSGQSLAVRMLKSCARLMRLNTTSPTQRNYSRHSKRKFAITSIWQDKSTGHPDTKRPGVRESLPELMPPEGSKDLNQLSFGATRLID